MSSKIIKGLIVIWLACGLAVSLPVQAGTLPDTAYIPNVSGQAQQYVLSCESRSAVDWAAFWGVSISESEFLAALPRSDNPEAGFVGDPNGAWGGIPPASYGVHAEPVARLLRAYGLQAQAQKGLSWNDLRAEIAAGRPAIVWVIGQMWSGTPIDYTAQDGTTTTVARFEHSMILFGYDESHVHVTDAYSGWNQTYPLETFLASWKVLGNMAITGQGLSSPAQPTVPPNNSPSAETYTVIRGDYLSALAERFGTTWVILAELNHIAYPYVIYPGQQLKLPNSQPSSPTEVSPETSVAQPTPSYRFHLLLPMIAGGQPASEPPPATQEPSLPTLAATETPAPKVYIVQAGDFLIELANRFGVDWRKLADLNNIPYPYVIYPGQQLTLP